MRIIKPTHISLAQSTEHSLTFEGQRNEKFQITVLEDDCVRVQFLPEGQPRLDRTWMIVGQDGTVPREGRSRDDLSPFSLPSFEVSLPAPPKMGETKASPLAGGIEGGRATHQSNNPTLNEDHLNELPPSGGLGRTLHLKTAALQIQITTGHFGLTWADAAGQVFASDQLDRAYTYDQQSRSVTHYLVRRPEEHYYGFGEKAGALDKRGRRMRMFNVDALGYNAETSDPLYKHFPFYITLVPELNIAYGLLYDNMATATFDMGSEIDNYYEPFRYYQADDGDIDYYLIYGPTVAEVVQKLAKLTGRMVLPPRWSLGFVASAWSPTEMPDAQDQLKRLVDQYGEHRMPCSLYQMSSGFSVMEQEKTSSGVDIRSSPRYVFHWNRSRIPDPKAMTDYFHEAGIRVAANIKPGLLTSHPHFETLAAAQGFIQAAEADEPFLNMFWGGDGGFLDFTNPFTFEWWKTQVREQLLAFGVDVTWNDNNEYTLWDDEARCHGFGDPLRIGLSRPLHGLLMMQASYEAQQAFAPNERPFVITRSGGIGLQRYAQTWSGDNETSWHTLRFNIPMGLSMSLSNAPSIGHDVGGLVGAVPSAELLVRWVQNGIFHPRFTIHSWTDDETYTSPWMYPDVENLMRSLFQFRYQLIPYLYTLFFEATRTGEPMIRPLVYQFQHDPNCHTESFDFMCGPNLLVASILEEGVRSREVYLPTISPNDAGQWCNFHTGEWVSGGQTIEADAPLERIPLFAPAGSFIPLGRAMRYVGERPDDVRQIHCFPHPETGEGSFTLIEDDGLSLAYKDGEYTELILSVKANPEQIEINLNFGQQGITLPYQEIEFILPAGETRPVILKSIRKITVDEAGRRHIVVPV